MRFERILQEAPHIHLHHFEIGQQAIEFINALSDSEKQNLLLLTDYELLNQPLHGIDVIQDGRH